MIRKINANQKRRFFPLHMEAWSPAPTDLQRNISKFTDGDNGNCIILLTSSTVLSVLISALDHVPYHNQLGNSKKNNVKCPHPASQSHDRISTFTIYWKTAMLWWIDDRGVNLVVSWSKCVEMQRWCWWLISWTEATTFQDLHNDVDRKWLDVLVNYNIWLALQDALQKKNQVWNCWSSKPQTIAK